MHPKERAIRQKLKDDFAHYAEKCLTIRTKSEGLKPFILNPIQIELHRKVEQQRAATGKVRVIILKPRQVGGTTYIAGRFFHQVTHQKGVQTFILTHEQQATQNLFAIAQRFYQHCPLSVRPEIERSNIQQLSFLDMDSGYRVGTAGNRNVGRSATVQFLHMSEVALYENPEEISKGLLNAVPRAPGTEIFMESTANGLNYFHEQWQMAVAGQSEFMPIFFPWFAQAEYTAEVPRGSDFQVTDEEQQLIDTYGITIPQLNWRRIKLADYGIRNAERAFKQEYPCCAAEAFQTSGGETFISPTMVMRARKTHVDSAGPLIIGVDPAGSGEDRTAIIRRKGRVAFNLQTFNKLDTTEIIGILHNIIEREKPIKMCIDVGSFGIGIYDRLRELGHKDIVIGVNSATVALDQDKYFNRRAEMWGLMKLWLQDDPCQIPDVDDLHADLCSYNYDESEHVDSRGRLKLEKKIALKKRNIRSPDCADALALTFAVPHSVFKEYNKPEKDHKAAQVMSQLLKVQRVREQGKWV